MVLTPLTRKELENIFDESSLLTIEFLIKKSLFAQPELLPNQKLLPIQIPKEHIEQWIVQAIGGEAVGAGSYPVDVIKGKEFGADVKMLSCKVNLETKELLNYVSGETSLAQKFKDAGDNLDNLFANHQYEEILDGFKIIVKEKLEKVKRDKKVDNIYYFFILRAMNTFYLCGLKVNLEEISNVSVGKVTRDSVFADNYIDSKLGNVKVYKAKKRLELRLIPKKWVDSDLVIKFEMKPVYREVSLRGLVENNLLDDYKDEIVGEIFD